MTGNQAAKGCPKSNFGKLRFVFHIYCMDPPTALTGIGSMYCTSPRVWASGQPFDFNERPAIP